MRSINKPIDFIFLGFVLYGTYGFQNSCQDLAEKVPLLSAARAKEQEHFNNNNNNNFNAKSYGGVQENLYPNLIV